MPIAMKSSRVGRNHPRSMHTPPHQAQAPRTLANRPKSCPKRTNNAQQRHSGRRLRVTKRDGPEGAVLCGESLGLQCRQGCFTALSFAVRQDAAAPIEAPARLLRQQTIFFPPTCPNRSGSFRGLPCSFDTRDRFSGGPSRSRRCRTKEAGDRIPPTC